ncbi:hypothetical protein [Massilibacteroides sp.]|uniref:hypothetical protein n=1 Tax=Massilibacteroides sp. TaxID=2034766 RepID=UPI0026259E52|nr:hypothetical protein [Massilibacteroides sp.]MDD4516364.1 hypothetical protein [Massilibacteroides sp.]
MTYEDKIQLLEGNDFISLFSKLGAAPRWVMSAGKRSIQLIGLCHKGDNHSALFDPSTMKVHCFSECGRAMYLHTWIKEALGFGAPHEAKDFLEDWIDGQEIDLSNRTSKGILFDESPINTSFSVKQLEPIAGIPEITLLEITSDFLSDEQTLAKLVWHKEDKIEPSIMKKFGVMYCPEKDTIILPHHNARGEIVGFYERSFKPLRRNVKERFPDIPYLKLLEYPRAKYVPLLRPEKYQTEEKTSWSFSNSFNLYGLHLAKEAIKEEGIAIIFEGAKSVMLSNQYKVPYAVASHTFGCHENHINMLIEQGAKEIVLAFDKQYEIENGKEWDLYELKTKRIAERVGDFVKISRILDKNNLLSFKDSPIDKGSEIFYRLLREREPISKEIPVVNPEREKIRAEWRKISAEFDFTAGI